MRSEYGRCTKNCLAARLRPNPLGKLKVPQAPCCIYGKQSNGEATAGRIKGQMRGGERTEGRGKREGNERKERGVVPHPKLNPGCATGSLSA